MEKYTSCIIPYNNLKLLTEQIYSDYYRFLFSL